MNRQLLEETLTAIRDNPEAHDQAHWAQKTDCGTACCFAGRALLLSGYTLRHHPLHPFPDFIRPDGTKASLPGAEAAEVLGIDGDDCWALFESTNTFDQVERIVKDLLNRPA